MTNLSITKSRFKREIDQQQLREFCQQHNTTLDPLIMQLRQESLATFDAGPMMSPLWLGQWLHHHVQTHAITKALEIGTFTGFSSCCIATAMPAHGKLICLDTSVDWTVLAIKYWRLLGIEHQIDLRIGTALHALEDLLQQNLHNQFELIYIDADKSNYPNYFRFGMNLLIPGGCMLIDNMYNYGNTCNPNCHNQATRAIRLAIENINKHPQAQAIYWPIGDGICQIIKTVAPFDKQG